MPTEVEYQDNGKTSPQNIRKQDTREDKNDYDDHEWQFSCRCESAKAVSTLLKCLRNGNSISDHSASESSHRRSRAATIQPVTVYCSAESVTFQVYGMARQSQASVDLQAGLFSQYRVIQSSSSTNADIASKDEHQDDSSSIKWQARQEFCVNLSTVLDCLHVLGTQNLDRTILSLSFNKADNIFQMELLEDGVLSTAEIPTMLLPEENTASLAYAFRSSPIVARIILKSEWLKEALQELELVTGVTCCTVALGPDGLTLAAVGNLGECLIKLPSKNEGSGIVSLECTVVHGRTYPLDPFMAGMKGLDIAEETCISMNDSGMIAIQHQVLDLVGQGSPNFVDFIMSCLQDEEDNKNAQESVIPRNMPLSQHSSSSNPYSLGWENGSTTRPRSSGNSSSLISRQISPNTDKRYDTSSDDESEDDEQLSPTSKQRPLFGSLDVTAQSGTSKENRNVRRRRRTRTRLDLQGEDAEISVEGSDSFAGKNSQNDESEDLGLNVTISTPRRRSRHEYDGGSSPELEFK